MEPDQRKAERQEVHQAAIISVLGNPTPALQAEILNISEVGIQIWLDQPLGYASLVRIEYDDNLLLGEVVYCQQERAGWLVGISVEHALLGVKARAHTGGR
jgi:hypothetical protein